MNFDMRILEKYWILMKFMKKYIYFFLLFRRRIWPKCELFFQYFVTYNSNLKMFVNRNYAKMILE